MSAENLGRKLLGEVEEVGLDEILNSLRSNDNETTSTTFGIPPLDTMLKNMSEFRQSNMPPVLELISLVSGGGKTHLLYHLTAIAIILKAQGGRQSAVVIIDTDGRFSVPRLAEQVKLLLAQHSAQNPTNASPSPPSDMEETIHAALRHVHIFHPHSLASTTATLRSLPTYLFNPTAHHSFDRAVAFIGLDSASAFYWQYRSEADDAALVPPTGIAGSNKSARAYTDLLSAFRHSSKVLNAPLIFTNRHLGALKDPNSMGPSSRSFRPSLPPPWPNAPTLRLVVHRAAVRKLPVQISVEEAKRESETRQQVVREGKFECFVDEFGVEERVLQRLRVDGAGFDFRITAEGVVLRSEVARADADADSSHETETAKG
ncbi:rad51 family DNA repair protein [Zymoseptoria brevis]|uniref:Rad51 family DNA repair protein n=1 Tax=Zymoseptoria brevis TaxID=1047168 RepID=A0A0F4GP61_9PEZI|nr:rad51 family DNA repair protein [Zymoseptoria brevis]